ncbi:MAG: RidA family protein [Candidatus Ranarchaeia archaeon]
MGQPIFSSGTPKPVGPYSPAIRVGNFLFVSGQIPVDPVNGGLVQGDIGTQTHQVMKNIVSLLSEAGASLDSIVKATIFLVDIRDYSVVNSVYGTYFKGTPPARSTVQVSGLPLGARIEIEVIAYIP